MYCKKCGRKLDDDQRFCDRCGWSVRQSRNTEKEIRRREIEELKEERLNRRQKLQEKDNKKKYSKNINQSKLLAMIFGLLLVVFVLIIVVTYVTTLSHSKDALWRTTDGSVAINATATPGTTAVPTNKALSQISPLPTSTAYAITTELNSDGYREFKSTGGAIFCYPSNFIQQSTEGNQRLKAYDRVGGGLITLAEDGPVSGEAKELMAQYAKSMSGKTKYSRAGDGWYIVETEDNGTIYHRKCIIINNIAAYYDFSYSTSSSSAEEYEKNIKYIDEHFN